MAFWARKTNLFLQDFRKNAIFATTKINAMNELAQTHRKGITIVFNLLFWLVACHLFLSYTLLRPMCNTHPYKEFVCFGLIVAVVYVTRWITIPKLLSNGKYGLFWLISVCMLLLAVLIELLLVKSDIEENEYFTLNNNTYLLYVSGVLFLRDSCFFAWFLVLRLYTLQKETFKAKQRASVLEHQAVQFSTPDHKEISIPIDLIVYIQEKDHSTRVHCTTGEVITVEEPFSHCKKMIPDTFWTLEGPNKMVFHQHLSEYVQTQSKPEIREIKTVIMLSDRQYRIFKTIRENPGCNAAFLYDRFRKKVTMRTIERDLATLRSNGVIVHTGTNKEGGYEICHQNVVSLE